jgi:nitrogen PTS system EIIA component
MCRGGTAGYVRCKNNRPPPSVTERRLCNSFGQSADIDGLAARQYRPPLPQTPCNPAPPFRSLGMSMTLTDLIAPNAIVPALKVNNKKQAIQELASRAAELTGQNERAILEILLQREKLGSTGVGNGVAIPHGKLPKLGRLFGLFARLERPIDFEALDGQPVDLIFLLLAPEAAGADHLKALARVARLLRDSKIARGLRDSRDADALYAVLSLPPASSAA